MTQPDALLAAIRANPADDLPRLVYADWLDEHGDPDRAEFIRLQIADDHPNDAECHCERCRRQVGLGASNGWWEGPTLPGGLRGWFQRGFVGGVRCWLPEWLEHGPSIVTAHPMQRVELVDRIPLADSLDGWAWFCQSEGEDVPEPEFLPHFVFDRLPGEPRSLEGTSSRYKEYPSREAAEDALSVALIAWAREQHPASG